METDDLRTRLSSVLDSIDDETLRTVIGGVFTMEKLTMADFECPECGAHGKARVRVPDYRGITTALATLTDQGKGKAATAVPPAPKEASREEMMAMVREAISGMSDAELARLG